LKVIFLVGLPLKNLLEVIRFWKKNVQKIRRKSLNKASLCLHVCMYLHMYVRMCECIEVQMYLCINAYMCVLMYICIHVHVFMYMYVLMYSNIFCINVFLYMYVCKLSATISSLIYVWRPHTCLCSAYNEENGTFEAGSPKVYLHQGIRSVYTNREFCVVLWRTQNWDGS
jgi:hypothetical protein